MSKQLTYCKEQEISAPEEPKDNQCGIRSKQLTYCKEQEISTAGSPNDKVATKDKVQDQMATAAETQDQMATAEIDLEKPGFFHLIPELVQGNMSKSNVISWYKKHQQEPDYLVPNSPEKSAINNTIGVLKYVLEGREPAIEYFKLLEEREDKPSINTMANLQWLYGKETGSMMSHWEEDDIARGLCEQGYFASFYNVEEDHNPEHARMSLQLLDEGLKRGSGQIMDRQEIILWRYYRFRAKKYVYLEHLQTRSTAKEFQDTMSAFLEFYRNAGDDFNYYKASVLIEVALMFSFDRKHLENQPELLEYCRSEAVIWDIWNDVTQTCAKALELYSNNYSLPLKASKVFSQQKRFSQAEMCIERSLELNPGNIAAIGSKIANYIGLSRNFLAKKDFSQAKEILMKGYRYGKQMERSQGQLKPIIYVDMCTICLSLSRRCRTEQAVAEDFLDDAIRYGEKAMETSKDKYYPRLFNSLAQCYSLKGDHMKELYFQDKAANHEVPGCTHYLMFYLKALLGQYRKRADDTLGSRTAVALEKGYLKHPTDSVLQAFRDYASFSLSDHSSRQFLKCVLMDLSSRQRSNPTSADVLKILSGVICRNSLAPQWILQICQQFL